MNPTYFSSYTVVPLSHVAQPSSNKASRSSPVPVSPAFPSAHHPLSLHPNQVGSSTADSSEIHARSVDHLRAWQAFGVNTRNYLKTPTSVLGSSHITSEQKNEEGSSTVAFSLHQRSLLDSSGNSAALVTTSTAGVSGGGINLQWTGRPLPDTTASSTEEKEKVTSGVSHALQGVGPMVATSSLPNGQSTHSKSITSTGDAAAVANPLSRIRQNLLAASEKVEETREMQRCKPAKLSRGGGGGSGFTQWRSDWKRGKARKAKNQEEKDDAANGTERLEVEREGGGGGEQIWGKGPQGMKAGKAKKQSGAGGKRAAPSPMREAEEATEDSPQKKKKRTIKVKGKAGAGAEAVQAPGAFRLEQPLSTLRNGAAGIMTDISFESLLDAQHLFVDVKRLLDDPDRIQAPPLFVGFLTNVEDSTNFSMSSASGGKVSVPPGVHPRASHRCVTNFVFRWKDTMYVLSSRVGFAFLLRVLRELSGVEVITFNAPALLLVLLGYAGGQLATHCVSDVRVMCWMAHLLSAGGGGSGANGASDTTGGDETGRLCDYSAVHRQCLSHLEDPCSGSKGGALQVLVNQVHSLAPLYRTLYGHLGTRGLLQAFLRQEKRVSLLIAMMKYNGVTVDMHAVGRFEAACTAEMTEARERAKAMLPQIADFNIQSHDDCREAIYEVLDLGKHLLKEKKDGSTAAAVSITKGGKLSTAEETLQLLARHHEFPALILVYRKAAKLMQTYVQGMMSYVLPSVDVSMSWAMLPPSSVEDHVAADVGVKCGDNAFVDCELQSAAAAAAAAPPLRSFHSDSGSPEDQECCTTTQSSVSGVCRLHPNFLHEGTDTGRLSCAEPNLQSLPRSSFSLSVNAEESRSDGHCGSTSSRHPDLGEEAGERKEAVAFRRCFVAPPGCVLLSVDYQQIELRILAHLCADNALVDALTHSTDIHRSIAELVFKRRPVSSEERNLAKRVVFGVLYGAGPRTLAAHMQVSIDEALHISSLLKGAFPQIDAYQRRIVEQGRASGFVRTISGRVRYLPDINSSVMAKRTYAERQAFNSVIQGSAADVMKLSMLAVERDVLREFPRADIQLLAQVHDELVFSVAKDKLSVLLPLVTHAMSRATSLLVPLTVTAKFGPSLGELEEWSVEHDLGVQM